jgi:hypothetical protein
MKFNYKRNIPWVWIVTLFASHIAGCRKFTDIPSSPTLVNNANVYSNDATAIAVLTGIFTDMSKPNVGEGIGSFTGLGSISLMTGLSSDELTLYSGVTSSTYQAYFKNALSVSVGGSSSGFEFWPPLYNYIYRSNAAIEGLSSKEAQALTPSIRQQLTGEAKFLRAFFYFYLVNLYGDVPLALNTDYTINASLARTSGTSVYQQIISDLQDAESLLSDKFLDGTVLKATTERVRPTKWAASALLARAFLYMGDYLNAESQASAVIGNLTTFNLSDSLDDVFLKNSNEAIWQLQPVTLLHNTEDGWIFNLPISGPTDISGASVYPSYLSSQQVNSYEANDLRKTHWVGSIVSTTDGKTYFYPYKYKIAILGAPVTEYLMVMRLGEQYLIRAEARTQLGNVNGAQTDLNSIRVRAGLTNTVANDKTSLLAAVIHERQTELFTEFGHRWFDLKRTGNVNAVMTVITPQKGNGSGWQPYQQLYPLPQDDLNKAPNLKQNTGY